MVQIVKILEGETDLILGKLADKVGGDEVLPDFIQSEDHQGSS